MYPLIGSIKLGILYMWHIHCLFLIYLNTHGYLSSYMIDYLSKMALRFI